MVFKDGEGDELVLVLELLLVDDFVKQSCDMFRRIVKGTATESTEHDAVVSVQIGRASCRERVSWGV